MSELPHIVPIDRADNDKEAKIYEVDDYISPEKMSDEDVMYYFFSQLSHPGTPKQSSEFGEYIQKLLGSRKSESPSIKNQAWKDRMSKMLFEIDELSDEDLDILLENDEILQLLYKALIGTQNRAQQLKEERRALLLLRELRAYLVMNEDHEPEIDIEWKKLIEKLSNA